MFKSTIALLLLSTASIASADVFKFTVTNGANMPISPGVLYVSASNEPESYLGSASTAGFTKLCQTGMTADRAAELKANPKISQVVETTGPILPGESRTFEVELKNKSAQGVHFETMYGKTKDLCGVVSVNRHSLTALSQHVTNEIAGKDQVVLSGGFTEPVVGAYPETMCASATGSVDCLRMMSQPVSGQTQVRAFNGYLPSVINFLDSHYGSEDTLTLLVPTGGALRYNIVLKH